MTDAETYLYVEHDGEDDSSHLNDEQNTQQYHALHTDTHRQSHRCELGPSILAAGPAEYNLSVESNQNVESK